MEALCNYLLLGGFKTKHKAYFTPYLLVQNVMNREILEKKSPAMNVEDQFIWGFKTTVGPRTGNEWMEEMDLTGYGMWYTYHRIKPAHT